MGPFQISSVRHREMPLLWSGDLGVAMELQWASRPKKPMPAGSLARARGPTLRAIVTGDAIRYCKHP
jgi:hypothetical protein